jgi:hypothetical protein
MASDGNPGKLAVTSVIQGSQAIPPIGSHPSSGKSLPAAGKKTPAAAAAGSVRTERTADAVRATHNGPPPRNSDPQSLVDLLNKNLNDSGRPDQFRLDPASGDQLIQQINPANGAVVAEFSVDEFPALARSVGATGLLIDNLA